MIAGPANVRMVRAQAVFFSDQAGCRDSISAAQWRDLQATLDTLSHATQAVSLADVLGEPEAALTQEAV